MYLTGTDKYSLRRGFAIITKTTTKKVYKRFTEQQVPKKNASAFILKLKAMARYTGFNLQLSLFWPYGLELREDIQRKKLFFF